MAYDPLLKKIVYHKHKVKDIKGLLDQLAKQDLYHKLKVGRWFFCPFFGWYALSDVCIGADLMAFPFALPRKMRFDRIGVYVSRAGIAGSQFRLGVYDDLDVYPNDLLVDSGVIDGTEVGSKEVSIDLTLEPLNWLAIHANPEFGSNGNIRCSMFFNLTTNMGLKSLDAMEPLNCCAITRSFQALPSKFPEGAWEGNYILLVGLRLAELL